MQSFRQSKGAIKAGLRLLKAYGPTFSSLERDQQLKIYQELMSFNPFERRSTMNFSYRFLKKYAIVSNEISKTKS